MRKKLFTTTFYTLIFYDIDIGDFFMHICLESS